MNGCDGFACVIESLKSWASRPFREEMNATQWFLFTGLVIVAVILWLMVLRELKGAI